MAPDDDKTRTHAPLTKDTMVSHYRIIEKIGAGGMGEVHLAEDTKLDRRVALKFLPLHLCQDADCRARFKREAQAAAKLGHSNIVAVHEVGEHNGRPFFAMELVEGRSLDRIIAEGRLDESEIVELALGICNGLRKAHESGVIHRDIKPSNIIVDRDNVPRVLDFGLAVIRDSDKLTHTGSTLGTIGYMSPEQVAGRAVDACSDLFSLGVVLYEMCTGINPFRRDNQAATLKAISEDIPKPLECHRGGISGELQRIVNKLLEKRPELRYQTAADLAGDLRRLSGITPVIGRRSRKRWFVGTGVAVVLIGCIVVGYVLTRNQTPEDTRKMLAVLPFENLGSPEDEYFADGITDEITGKLATIRELGVISRTSTMQYKKTTKGLRQIAKELGVDYILEGTIRWDKGGDTDRVRILPQLIRVSDDTHLWAETFQRPLTDVFALQADIATRIAEAMNITLRGSEVIALNDMPTRNLEAYQAYLRGTQANTDQKSADFQQGVQMLERAVELDPTFALANARLSIAHSMMFHFGFDRTPDRLLKAKLVLDRASRQGPDLGWTRVAASYYYYYGFRDYGRALEELSVAGVSLPSDAQIHALRGYILRRRGEWQVAIAELDRAFQLSPRQAIFANDLSESYMNTREYELAEQYADISIALSPDQTNAYILKAWNFYSWRGDTLAARQTLLSVPKQRDVDIRVNWFQLHLYERNYGAALNDAASLPELILDLEATTRTLLSGKAYYLMGQHDSARCMFDSARIMLERESRDKPDDYRIPGPLGIAYAGLDRKAEAIRSGKLGIELLSLSKDALSGTAQVEALIRVYVMVGEYDAALEQIEILLSIPSFFSVPYLQLDPLFDPLRKLPRYQKLMEKYGT